jgi:hypothetical protein
VTNLAIQGVIFLFKIWSLLLKKVAANILQIMHKTPYNKASTSNVGLANNFKAIREIPPKI